MYMPIIISNIYVVSLHLCMQYVYIQFVYPLVVPALYKKPDLKIFKTNDTKYETILVEANREYYAMWDPEILDVNELNESCELSLFQNWIFGLITINGLRMKQWFNRAVRQGNQNRFLKIISNETNRGMISFEHIINRKLEFDLSLLVLVKKTRNLKINYASTFLSFLYDGDTTIEACAKWYQHDKKLAKGHLSSCPCNMKSAIFDNQYEPDLTCFASKAECHENINANRCYLRRTKKMYGSICANIDVDYVCTYISIATNIC